MNNRDPEDRTVLSGELLDNDDIFGSHRRRERGENMHGHHRHGRHARWHMKMAMGGRGGHGRGGAPAAPTSRAPVSSIRHWKSSRTSALPKCGPRMARRPSTSPMRAKQNWSARPQRWRRSMNGWQICSRRRRTLIRQTCAQRCTGCATSSSRPCVTRWLTKRANGGSSKS